MKILFIQGSHPDDKIGGAELQSWILAKNLAKTNQITYFATKNNSSKIKKYEKQKVHVVKMPRMKKYSIKEFICIYKVINEKLPDIIHLRYFEYIIMIRIITYLLKLPLIYHVSHDHNCMIKPPNKNSFKKKIFHALNFLCLYMANGVVLQNDCQKQLFRYKPQNYIVISNSVDKYSHCSKNLSNQRVILWVGNIKYIKNPLAFIEIAKELKECNCKFIMIGYPQDNKLSTIVKKNSKSLQNLIYIPGVKYDNIYKYFEQASVFVCTSYAEGFPNTFIQAMSANCPIISMSVDPDYCFTKHRIGLLSGTLSNLKKDILKVLEDADLQKQIIQNSTSYLNRYFNSSNNAKRLEIYFTKFLTKRRRPYSSEKS
jgi:glycosyltransferase involved in cell wall biosynthesis